MNPVIFEIGWFRPRYYGLMYLLAFATTYGLVAYRIQRETRFKTISARHVKEAMLRMIIGALVGGRLGYVLFYDPAYFLDHPAEIFLPVTFDPSIRFIGYTGMSFHGGLIGVGAGAWGYAQKNRLNFLDIADLFAPAVPLGYTFGRLGNFINGELFGKITSVSIGMRFPQSPEWELRHPSQLYEAFFEGIFLFVVLWNLRRKPLARGAMFSMYIAGYGLVRFGVEFFRQPDAHIGHDFMFFSRGQLLCAVMVVVGVMLFRRFSMARGTRPNQHLN